MHAENLRPVSGHVDSYYAASVSIESERPALERDRSTKVCVVGGGLTGLAVALELASRNVDVVVLEANHVGWGASGRNGGQVLPGFTGEMESLRRLVGAETAGALWRMSVDGVALIEKRCADYDIDCDLRRGGLTAATRARNMEDHALWCEDAASVYGYHDLELLDRASIRAEIASERYHGGVLDKGARHLHPLKYCRGLARAAEAMGAEIYECSHVAEIEAGARPVIHCGGGAVAADHVVLAGNAYLGDLNRYVQRRAMPVATYIGATVPLGEARARALIANGYAVCDDRHVLDYYRLSADHRLLFGGEVSYAARSPADIRAFMRRRMVRVFPQLGDVAIEYGWGGNIAITRDRFPDVGAVTERITYAQGYSGHGLALSGIVGRALAAAITGDKRDFDILATVPHKRFPGGTAWAAPLLVLGELWHRMKGNL